MCVVANASGGSLNVMNFVILNSKRDKCFLNIVAAVRGPNKENTIQRKENSYMRPQTKAYSMLRYNNALPNGELNHSAAELNLFLT